VDNWNSPEQLEQLEQTHLANVLAIESFFKKKIIVFNWNNWNSPEQLEQLEQTHLANVLAIELFLKKF
jgi:hypothetical protein